MKLNSLLLAGAALFVATGASAQSTTLTFDALSYSPYGEYGDGAPLGPTTSDGQSLSFTESGYILTLHTLNPVGSSSPHIGDAGAAFTFNWHDDGDNLPGAYVTLSKVGGGSFNLNSFDYSSMSGNGLTVSGGLNSLFFSNTSGTAQANFANVSSVTFASTGYSRNQLDNIKLSAAAVPEPATWAMMVMGFGMVGFGLRSRRKVSTKVSFA